MRRVGWVAVIVLALAGFPAVASADDDVLQSSDRMGLQFEESSKPEPEGQATTITVSTPNGQVVQTISEPFKGWLGTAPIALRDLDQDGRDDLLVEVDGRTNDHLWAIWHTTGDSTKFTRVGVVSGEPDNVSPGVFGTHTEQGDTLYTIKGGAVTPVS